MRFLAQTLVGVVAVLALAAPSFAWQNVCEDTLGGGGDAGSLPGNARFIGGGLGGVSGISGRLEGLEGSPGPGGDFQDMYLVYIANPDRFAARVQGVGFVPQVWLFQGQDHANCFFQVEGGGLLGTAGLAGSAGTLLMRSTDLVDPVVVFDPGYYYIAITGISETGDMSVPVSSGGEIFAFDGESVSGPDGPGGLMPVTMWTAGGGSGSYNAQIEGLVPPCTGDFNNDFFVNLEDLLIVLSNWQSVMTGDFGFQELISVLAGWGACPVACCLCDGYGSCVELDPVACVMAGGVPNAPGVFCSTDPCRTTVGACCLGGGCEHRTELECLAVGGIWTGPGVGCAPDDPCAVEAPTEGACCIGIFTVVCMSGQTPYECDSLGGFFAGIGTNCATTDICLGACCDDDGTCTNESFFDCLPISGVWLGPGIPCEASPDPLFDACDCTTVGPCCTGGEACLEIPERFCVQVGGTYFGDDSTCAEVACAGACCFLGTCTVVDEPFCTNTLNGLFAGLGTSCSPDPCPTLEAGACCLVLADEGGIADLCQDFSEAQCAIAGGRFAGVGSTCVMQPCPGVCCTGSGTCTEVSEAECVSANRRFLGIGTTCIKTSCEGACCMADESCLDTTQSVCTSAGGSWADFCTDCTETSCASLPKGGCCMPGGSCLEQRTQIDCEFAGGIYRGNGVLCAPNPCEGVCCQLDGSCSEETESECTQMGGSYRGGGTTCDQGLCVGTCCLPPSTCGDGYTLDDCTQAGGDWSFGAYCIDEPCPTGACCFPDNQCVEIDVLECLTMGGVFAGFGTSCGIIPCPLGACCLPDGTCVIVNALGCLLQVGIWAGAGVPCDPDPCPALVTGACCIGANCAEITEVHCAELGGVYQGDASTCDPDPCP